MALTDMKRPKPKKSEMDKMVQPAMVEGDRYPWGLRIRLEKDELEKLGVGAADFKIGQTVTIQAQGKVTSISSRESTGSEKAMQDVAIQIEKVDLGMNSSKFADYSKTAKGGPGE